MRQVIFLLSLLSAQFNVPTITKPEHPHAELEALPEQRKPDEKTLKAEYAKSLTDVTEIVRMSQAAQAELEKGDHQALPANAPRLLGESEKKAKAAKRRLKR